MVGDPDREANIATNIKVLQERVHDALDLADLLRVIANLSDCVELVEQENATMPIRECEEIADVARSGAQEGRHQTIQLHQHDGQIELLSDPQS